MSFIKQIRVGDIILIIFIVSFSFIYYNSLNKNKSDKIIIETPYNAFRYDLSMNDREIIVDGILGESRIIIENHSIRFDTAPCRDKLCIRAGILKNAPLICMPNGIIIRYDSIKSDDGLEIDSIVQ